MPVESSSPTLPDFIRILGELFRYVRRMFDDAALASPDADVRVSFTAVVNAKPADIIFHGDEPYIDKADCKHLTGMLIRRVVRESLQYILGTAPMMSLGLQARPSVFVPRSKMELFAQWAIDRAREPVVSDVIKPKIVNLHAGSGALVLAVIDAASEADVVAVGPSEWAWAQAMKDIETYDNGCVCLIVGDVTDDQLIDDGGELADWVDETNIVASNPPYVPEGIEAIPGVRIGPHSTVFDGNDELDAIRPMMNLVDAPMRSGGVIDTEHDDSSGDGVSSLLKGTWDCVGIEVRRGFVSRDRFTVGRKN